eukprot:365019-Chlamydomonas_euryale.AAC.22
MGEQGLASKLARGDRGWRASWHGATGVGEQAGTGGQGLARKLALGDRGWRGSWHGGTGIGKEASMGSYGKGHTFIRKGTARWGGGKQPLQNGRDRLMRAPGIAIAIDACAVTHQVRHNVALTGARREAQWELAVVHGRAVEEKGAVCTRTHICAILDEELDLGCGRAWVQMF